MGDGNEKEKEKKNAFLVDMEMLKLKQPCAHTCWRL